MASDDVTPEEDAADPPYGYIPDPDSLEPGLDWTRVDMSQFGVNFEVVEDAPKPKKKAKKTNSTLRKFLRGKSPRIYLVFTPKVHTYKVRKPKPINEGSKVTPKQKQAWEKALVKNIDIMSQFLERELLPLTSAISTAVLDSQERYSQLVEDPTAKLPLAFLIKKANLAAQLKIIDRICDIMDLSPENRKLMKADYRTPRDPSVPPQGKQTPNG